MTFSASIVRSSSFMIPESLPSKVLDMPSMPFATSRKTSASRRARRFASGRSILITHSRLSASPRSLMEQRKVCPTDAAPSEFFTVMDSISPFERAIISANCAFTAFSGIGARLERMSSSAMRKFGSVKALGSRPCSIFCRIGPAPLSSSPKRMPSAAPLTVLRTRRAIMLRLSGTPIFSK